MQYVASHTKIPIPKLHAIHILNQRIYIEMEFVRGDTLSVAWRRDGGLTLDQKNAIFADIKQHITALRELPAPEDDLVSSAYQNPAIDYRVGQRFFGPVNHHDFHSLVRGHLRMEDVRPFLGDEVDKVHTSHYQTHFTHADLAPRNIIVRNGRVVSIIDWGFAGWYPEYWEFTKAQFNYVDDDWHERVATCFPSYENELEAEQTLWRRLPDQGTPAFVYRDGVRHERDGSKPSAAWLKARATDQHEDLWSLALAHP